MDDSPETSNLLPHVIAVLHEARKDSGITWRQFEAATQEYPFARERSNCLDLERREPEAGDKYWPNLDDFVSCYSIATGVPAHVLWGRALRRAKEDRNGG